MATTSRPIDILKVGIRDTTGAVVASGLTRFYQPGTLVSQTVYSDAACTTPYSQPVTSDAGGQATVYTLEPVRMISKDSTDTTTHYDGVVNLNRHDAVYITHPDFNGGAEHTFETWLTNAATSLGDDFEFMESATAIGIPYATYLGEFCVSVKSYGALGDDSNDDTAEIQAAIDRVEARGGGWVFFPKGTYKISSALTVDFAGVRMFGAGAGVAIIKNYSTTGNAVVFNTSGTGDAIKDVTITASTTSSGTALLFSSGAVPLVRDVVVSKHRTGIDASAAPGAAVENVRVDSTDDNASAVGLALGNSCTVRNASLTSATVNGTGLLLSGTDTRATNVYVTKFSTGASLSGARGQLHGCYFAGGQVTAMTAAGASCMISHCYATVPTTGVSLAGTYSTASRCRITGATTGISLAARNTHADYCVLAACTTGVSVGAHTLCSVIGCDGDTNTLDLSVNSSATLFREDSSFTTRTNTAATPFGSPLRFRVSTTTSNVAGPIDWTPVHDPTVLNVFNNTYGAGAINLQINQPVTTNAQPGDVLHILVCAGASDTTNITGGTIVLKDMNGSALSVALGATADDNTYLAFIWNGSEYRQWLRIANMEE